MKMLIIVAGILLAVVVSGMGLQASAEPTTERDAPSLADALIAVTPPPLPGYDDANAHATYSGTKTVTYDIMSRGVISADMEDFARLAHETLADPRGWGRMGVKFERAPANGDFTLVLSAADMMTSFSALGCDPAWSCNVGKNVIINEDRWLGATAPWNAAGGSLRDYRHMVINHEVGHNLGREHESCAKQGNLAAVMQQQSFDLQGCKFNPWPLPSEVVRRAE